MKKMIYTIIICNILWKSYLNFKKKKQKKIRLIEPRIDQILHKVSEQIVSLAKEKNAAIFLEDLKQPKKSRFRQKRRVNYKLSQFNFKTLSDYIEYKAKREGI